MNNKFRQASEHRNSLTSYDIDYDKMGESKEKQNSAIVNVLK